MTMKKEYIVPEVELFMVSLEGCLCESNQAPLTDLEGFGDAIDFIW